MPCNYCYNSDQRCERCLRGQINRLEYELKTRQPMLEEIARLQAQVNATKPAPAQGEANAELRSELTAMAKFWRRAYRDADSIAMMNAFGMFASELERLLAEHWPDLKA